MSHDPKAVINFNLALQMRKRKKYSTRYFENEDSVLFVCL